MPFHPVTKDLVKEDRGCLSIKNRRAHEGFGHGRRSQLAKLLHHRFNSLSNHCIIGQPRHFMRIELVRTGQLAAVRCGGESTERQARMRPARSNSIPRCADQVASRGCGFEPHEGAMYVGMVAKKGTVVTNPLRPSLAVHLDVSFLTDVLGGWLAGEVRDVFVFGDADMALRAYLNQLSARLLVGLIRFPPECVSDRIGGELQRQFGNSFEVCAVHPGVRVVEQRRSDSNVDVQQSPSHVRVRDDCAVGGEQLHAGDVGHFVGEVMQRSILATG